VVSSVCFVAYHELGLKGRNRSTFERRLVANLTYLLDRDLSIQRIQGRILVEVPHGTDSLDIAQHIAHVPGVANVRPAVCVGRDLDEICHVALRAVNHIEPAPRTFRVTAKRSNTDFALTSQQINEQVGSFIDTHTDMTVDLSHPQVNIEITIVGGRTYISVVKLEGAGGLPVGSSGKLVSLLSSGIDSPVATWRMMRRGAVAIGLHFSGAPEVADTSTRQVAEIGTVLSRTGGLGRIYSVPFGTIQREISTTVYPDLRILVYRRVMLAVAERLARIEGAKALVTGESLGQVASQTLENMIATARECALPIFRPLIGDDKHDIVACAKRIGTFELSAEAVEDCCTLFMPRKPETHVKVERLDEACAQLDIEGFVERCLDSMSWHDYPCNHYQPPTRFTRIDV